MKTYLLVYDNQCGRCGKQWTTSYVVNWRTEILSPSFPVTALSGYFCKRQKHEACFNCLEPAAQRLPLPFASPGYGGRAPEVTSTPTTRVATLDDILGD